jgi:signal transduction histidine kinase/DNA-binding CsgD family transcriptional regulator
MNTADCCGRRNGDAALADPITVARIIAATDAERRRLERDLHDGAQQRLVSLALALRAVEAALTNDPEAARHQLASAREELALALDELRDLARGIHPAVLRDRGLGPALAALAARAPVTVQVVALPGDRLPEPVETAAYYLVAEALTNVTRHAHATAATVSVTRTGDRARIEVRDDGTGGADTRHGSGLRGLADRLEALGGCLELDSPPGAGTTLIGELPLGSSIRRRVNSRIDETGVEALTERELQVARLVVDRRTNPEIAEALFLSPKTVETHVRNIFRKLDASSRIEVARTVERADRAVHTI